MPENSPELPSEDYEHMLHTYVRFHSPVGLFPILESKENLWYLICHTSRLVAAKVAKEQSKDAVKGRPHAAFLRGLSWLDKLMWNELWLYPEDTLESRTARLLGIILHSPSLPRKSKEAYDPRRVALEYALLLQKLKAVIPRRPAKVKMQRLAEFQRATFGRERGTFVRSMVIMKNAQNKAVWIDKTVALTQKQIPVPWWIKARSFDLKEEQILKTTPREAVLRILAHFMNVRREMVWRLIKQGRALFATGTMEKLELAHSRRQHDPAACEFINCPDIRFSKNGQGI